MPISRTGEVEGVSAVMPLRASTAGGSGSFLVLADNGRRYWCKSLNNFQGARIPVTEQIVGRLARLIAAPACEVALVGLEAIAGWEFRPGSGRVVEAGWAHGSVAVDPAVETRALEHRTDDDNRRRHCGIYALCDWLAGSDVQWLYGVAEDNAYYSHDHGFYLTGPEWTSTTLAAGRDAPYALSIPPDQLDLDELARLADALDGLTRQKSSARCRSCRATGRSLMTSSPRWPSSSNIGVAPSLHVCERLWPSIEVACPSTFR